MNSVILDKDLFESSVGQKIGVGYANISDVLRASDAVTVGRVKFYEQRCGHVPLGSVDKSYVLVSEYSDVITSQLEYLSGLFGKSVEPKTAGELKMIGHGIGDENFVIVPYINVAETEAYLKEKFGLSAWGLPFGITDKLKNKASLHERLSKGMIDGLCVPDFVVSDIEELADKSEEFLQSNEALYRKYDSDCPPGLVVRFAECDGNYGAGVLLQSEKGVVFRPDGAGKMVVYESWKDALIACQKHIKSTINPLKERRVVVSRFIEAVDSPGMSLAVMDGEVVSLGWNSQLQGDGLACVGTMTYRPKTDKMRFLKQKYEDETAVAFYKLLKDIAVEEGIDLGRARGFANIDIITPGEREHDLQVKRFGREFNYLSESNPRFTNWTDALLTGVGVSHKRQSIRSMLEVISSGLMAEDKFKLPEGLDPRRVREEILKADSVLRIEGTRLIARMTTNPMGIIYMGDIEKGRANLVGIVKDLEGRK